MSLIARWLCLDKVANTFRTLKHNGGVFGTLGALFRMDTMKWGTLIGEDKYGNKYYQNDQYFYGSNRWVEYNKKVFLDYDASQVPAEWHNWLHYICDDPPTIKPRIEYKWMIDHTENFSGTQKAYVPYSTMPLKIESWSPKGTQIKIGPPK